MKKLIRKIINWAYNIDIENLIQNTNNNIYVTTRINWNDPKVKKIISDDTLTLKQMATKLGCSEAHICKVRTKLGLKRLTTGPRPKKQ